MSPANLIPVKDLMTTTVVTFHADTSVDEIASILTGSHFTGAPVLDDEGHVIGIVSEVDVFTKKGHTAREIMSPHVITVTEDTGVDAAARLLAVERIRRLPVMRAGRMVGLISRSDILEFFSVSHWICNACGHQVRGIEAPEICDRCQGTSFHLQHGNSPGH